MWLAEGWRKAEVKEIVKLRAIRLIRYSDDVKVPKPHWYGSERFTYNDCEYEVIVSSE